MNNRFANGEITLSSPTYAEAARNSREDAARGQHSAKETAKALCAFAKKVKQAYAELETPKVKKQVDGDQTVLIKRLHRRIDLIYFLLASPRG